VEIGGSLFGIVGFIFALWSFQRIQKLEKHLKEAGVLKKSYNSDEE
jgi:hypothetical protein